MVFSRYNFLCVFSTSKRVTVPVYFNYNTVVILYALFPRANRTGSNISSFSTVLLTPIMAVCYLVRNQVSRSIIVRLNTHSLLPLLEFLCAYIASFYLPTARRSFKASSLINVLNAVINDYSFALGEQQERQSTLW
jgi:hypothetical protein